MIETAILATLAAAATPAFEERTLPDQVLSEHRGGIRLPSGIDVTLSVDTRTAVDGAIVLQTVVKIDQGAPIVKVYAPEDGHTVLIPANDEYTNVGTDPTVTYDRQNGFRIDNNGLASNVWVSSRQADANSSIPDGLAEIDVTNPVHTDNGVVTNLGQVFRQGVKLEAPDVDVVHFTGNAFGSAIANSGNQRTIDTQTTISIDLRNAGPDVLGSTMFRVENVALDAMSTRY